MINYEPMEDAPSTITGGFKYSQTLYSVSKKGKLTKLAHANDCTYAGDPKIVIRVDKTIPRIAIKITRHGNGAWENTTYYKAT